MMAALSCCWMSEGFAFEPGFSFWALEGPILVGLSIQLGMIDAEFLVYQIDLFG